MTNGKLESGTSDYEKSLGEFELFCGFPELQLPGDGPVKELLSLPAEAFHRFTQEQCWEASVTLRLFTLHLQRVLNRERAKWNRCEKNIKRLLATEMPRINAYSYEERRALAVRNNVVACEIEKEQFVSQSRIDMLDDIILQIGMLAKTLEGRK